MKVADPVCFSIRKETLLQHARHLFATRGYAETSMDDLAKISGMRKASLYHYFSSKEQVLREMVDVEAARWATRLQSYGAGKTWAESLTNIATLFIEDMKEARRREFFSIIHFESYKNPVILRALKESPTHKREGLFKIFCTHLPGKRSRQEAAILMTQFMGSLLHYIISAKLRKENLCLEVFDDKAYVKQLVHTFTKGIKK